MSIDKAAILAAAKKPPKMEEVDIPDLGTVFVKVMSSRERDKWEEFNSKNGVFKSFRPRLMIATVCNADGSPMFTDAELPELGELPSTVVDPIWEVAKRINGLTPDDVKALEKNSGKTDGDSGPSVFLDGSERPGKSS